MMDNMTICVEFLSEVLDGNEGTLLLFEDVDGVLDGFGSGLGELIGWEN